MTAYLSSKTTVPVFPAASHGQAAQVQSAYALITVTAALTTADTMSYFYLPANARIIQCVLKCSDMDTNGTPTITLNVGDSGLATRYFSASVAAQAGTVDASMNPVGRFFKTTAKTLVVGSVGTGAATGVAGTIELDIGYIVEDLPTSP